MSSLLQGLNMKTIYNPSYQSLIEYLIELRKQQGLTQANLAQKLDKPQSYVAKLEGCERKLDVLEFVEICQALQVKASQVLASIEQ